MESVLDRLALPREAGLFAIYERLIAALSAMFGRLADALDAKNPIGG